MKLNQLSSDSEDEDHKCEKKKGPLKAIDKIRKVVLKPETRKKIKNRKK